MTETGAAVRRGLLASSLVFAALLCVSPDPAFAQCALCRDAVNAAPAQVREAMNYAIVGLALAPYGVALAAAWILSPDLRANVRARFNRTRFNRT